MKITSISRKLLKKVLCFYFILTLSVTGIQIIAEYFNTKSHIDNELLTLEKTISASLTRAVWELNTQQAVAIIEGLLAIPMVKGITVSDETGTIITQLGEVKGDSSITDALFGHSFPLLFEFSGKTISIGHVTLLSSNAVIFSRIKVSIYFLLGNAIVKTAFLIFLFTLAFNKLLTIPLREFTQQIQQINLDDPESSKLHSINDVKNELNILEDAYNSLIDELVEFKRKLAYSQLETDEAKDKIDEQNLLLEQEVAKKTSSLSRTMLKMKAQQSELQSQKQILLDKNAHHRKTEQTLINTNKDLKNLINELNKTKERLLEAEKMSSLGMLSAEMAHEINTPVGISITSTSYLLELITQFKQQYHQQTLSKKTIDKFTLNAQKSTELLIHNLKRASELLNSFKHIAVDQTSDKIRVINISQYLAEIIQSLHPKLKQTNHHVKIHCDENIELYSHPGAIAQILINLIINSLVHGFEHINNGEIVINVFLKEDKLHLNYQDNGHGLSATELTHLFDAFYTTKEEQGGTGLGAYIIKNLVIDTLNGTIEVQSKKDQGIRYQILLPDMRYN